MAEIHQFPYGFQSDLPSVWVGMLCLPLPLKKKTPSLFVDMADVLCWTESSVFDGHAHPNTLDPNLAFLLCKLFLLISERNLLHLHNFRNNPVC